MARKTRQNHEPEDMPLSGRVRAWRRSHGWTQGDLEVRAGLAHNAISRIENDEVSPRLETLERIASALAISVEQLQFGRPVAVEITETSEDGTKALMKQLSTLPDSSRQRAITLITELISTLKENA